MTKAKIKTITLTRKLARAQKECTNKCRGKALHDRNAQLYRADRLERYRRGTRLLAED
jgi:hypothetical protein